jgi:hypothetical protein
MILTDAEYHCLIGIPPRDHDREIIFRCIYNLTNSNGNAAIPLSSYGLNVTEQGDVRSVCAPDAPCLEFNALLGGPPRGNCRRVRIPGQVSTGGGRNAVTSVRRRCEPLPREWRTRMPHRNHLRGKLTLGNGLRRPDSLRQAWCGPFSSRLYPERLSRTAARSFNRSAFRRTNPVASV